MLTNAAFQILDAFSLSTMVQASATAATPILAHNPDTQREPVPHIRWGTFDFNGYVTTQQHLQHTLQLSHPAPRPHPAFTRQLEPDHATRFVRTVTDSNRSAHDDGAYQRRRNANTTLDVATQFGVYGFGPLGEAFGTWQQRLGGDGAADLQLYNPDGAEGGFVQGLARDLFFWLSADVSGLPGPGQVFGEGGEAVQTEYFDVGNETFGWARLGKTVLCLVAAAAYACTQDGVRVTARRLGSRAAASMRSGIGLLVSPSRAQALLDRTASWAKQIPDRMRKKDTPIAEPTFSRFDERARFAAGLSAVMVQEQLRVLRNTRRQLRHALAHNIKTTDRATWDDLMTRLRDRSLLVSRTDLSEALRGDFTAILAKLRDTLLLVTLATEILIARPEIERKHSSGISQRYLFSAMSKAVGAGAAVAIAKGDVELGIWLMGLSYVLQINSFRTSWRASLITLRRTSGSLLKMMQSRVTPSSVQDAARFKAIASGWGAYLTGAVLGLYTVGELAWYKGADLLLGVETPQAVVLQEMMQAKDGVPSAMTAALSAITVGLILFGPASEAIIAYRSHRDGNHKLGIISSIGTISGSLALTARHFQASLILSPLSHLFDSAASIVLGLQHFLMYRWRAALQGNMAIVSSGEQVANASEADSDEVTIQPVTAGTAAK